ncbi:hypothetical protein BDZ91DRAFT_755713 [Kalaharituber pfeilii]|nr:hypothetical protein BDZ91DRAFT_755713 [Kalaharituber pfeilii]
MKVRNSNKGGGNKHSTWFYYQFAENKTLNKQRQETIRNKREKDTLENIDKEIKKIGKVRKSKPGKQDWMQCVSTA